jgi:hypothetical protein
MICGAMRPVGFIRGLLAQFPNQIRIHLRRKHLLTPSVLREAIRSSHSVGNALGLSVSEFLCAGCRFRPAFYSNFDWLRVYKSCTLLPVWWTNYGTHSPLGGRSTDRSLGAARKKACWARLGRHIDLANRLQRPPAINAGGLQFPNQPNQLHIRRI